MNWRHKKIKTWWVKRYGGTARSSPVAQLSSSCLISLICRHLPFKSLWFSVAVWSLILVALDLSFKVEEFFQKMVISFLELKSWTEESFFPCKLNWLSAQLSLFALTLGYSARSSLSWFHCGLRPSSRILSLCHSASFIPAASLSDSVQNTTPEYVLSLYAGALSVWHTNYFNGYIGYCGCHEIFTQRCITVRLLIRLGHLSSIDYEFGLFLSSFCSTIDCYCWLLVENWRIPQQNGNLLLRTPKTNHSFSENWQDSCLSSAYLITLFPV